MKHIFAVFYIFTALTIINEVACTTFETESDEVAPPLELSAHKNRPLSVADYISSTLTDFNSDKFVHEFCPYIQTCNGNTPGTSRTVAFPDIYCCLPCDCEDSCYARGTCCHDKEKGRIDMPNKGLYTDEGEKCNLAMVFHDISMVVYSTYSSYMLIQRCPMEIKGMRDEIETRCMDPNENLDDLTPVTDMATLKHYRNIYCAMCNGVNETIERWRPEVLCSSEIDIPAIFAHSNTSKADAFRNVLNAGCAVRWNADVLPDTCLYQEYLESSCPLSFPSPVTQTYCETNGPYTPLKVKGRLYRNVFCIACITPFIDIDMLTNCFGEGYPSQDSTTLIALLDFSIYDKSGDQVITRDENRCKPKYNFLPQLGACYEIVCPPANVKVGHRCFPVFTNVGGVNLQIAIDVHSQIKRNNGQNNSHQDVKLDKSFINSVAMGVVRDLFPWVNPCHETAETLNLHDELVAKFTFTLLQGFLIDIHKTYFQILKYIDGKNEEFMRNGSGYRLAIGERIFNAMHTEELGFLSYLINSSMVCPGLHIALSSLQWEELIVVSNFAIMPNGTLITNTLVFEPYEYILRANLNPTVYIGKNVFISRYLSLSGAASIYDPETARAALCFSLFVFHYKLRKYIASIYVNLLLT